MEEKTAKRPKVLLYPHIIVEALEEATSFAVIETDQVSQAVNYCKNLLKTAARAGTIPNSIYFRGYTVEKSLAINVKEKGIALIVG